MFICWHSPERLLALAKYTRRLVWKRWLWCRNRKYKWQEKSQIQRGISFISPELCKSVSQTLFSLQQRAMRWPHQTVSLLGGDCTELSFISLFTRIFNLTQCLRSTVNIVSDSRRTVMLFLCVARQGHVPCTSCNDDHLWRSADNCTYDGKMYKQDQTWLVGCDQQCVCEDAVYGYYRCYNRWVPLSI